MTLSSGMCPLDCAALAALPALPSYPGLLAHLAAAPDSVRLSPQVTALVLTGHTYKHVSYLRIWADRYLDTTFALET